MQFDPNQIIIPEGTSDEDIKPIRSLTLVPKEQHAGAEKAVESLRSSLEEQEIKIIPLDEVLGGRPVDALVCLGGDGSLLHMARLMAPLNIPVVGVNFGRVGYLCAGNEEQLDAVIKALLSGEYRLERRHMVRAQIWHRSELVWQVDALNEILIGGAHRTLTLELKINDYSLGKVVGDGIITATRTGSTAYALAAGGPVSLLESMVLVPSNAITNNLFAPTVLPLDSVITVQNVTTKAWPFVIADGQKDFKIDEGTLIKIFCSPHYVDFIDPGLVHPMHKLTRASAIPRS